MAAPRIAAHRGGAALWPENSLTAFAGALALGVDLLEFDVHQSADGEPVVIHDATLDRTTEGTGPVSAQSAGTLRGLRLRNRDGALTDDHVPLLDDVLALASRAGAELLLEMKGSAFSVRYGRDAAGQLEIIPGPMYEGLEQRVLTRLEAAGMRTRTTIMAFNPTVIETVRRLAPSQRTTLLVSRDHVARAAAHATDAVAWAERLGVTDLGLEHTLIDADVVTVARAHGLRVGAWTPNDEPAIRRLVALGLDIITTDRLDLALRLRETVR
ncbi:MAG TPA: glycerophosphodiester phosphodiesterase family protein [Candidatus Acidoferrum sp.]|nr:glycerophosphodiester phosphodiesterase family protein [Candidatus Acidoferrum sp.]